MNQDIARILSLKRVLESAGRGSGVSRAIVGELGRADGFGEDAARQLLLGHPIAAAMQGMVEGNVEEVSLLASLIVAAPRSSAPLVGRSGGSVARTLEHWVKARENRALEQKVLRFRSLVTAGVLGAVTAMIASLGPIMGTLGPSPGPGADPAGMIYGAAAMTAISSGMLGAFMSGRGFFVNVLVALGAFALVSAVASPLAGVASVGLWGVK